MKVSLNWLKDYIPIDITVTELAERLTMLGLEVEDIEHLGAQFRNIVVGNVLEVRRHPSADRLTVCTVDPGGEPLSIVCGAPNVASGEMVAVALPGAEVPHNQHDPNGGPFVVTTVKIRGETSHGMICSAYELGLGDDRDGILLLDPGAKPGTPLAQYLGTEDIVLEIGVTPNRPDALSHIGIAREIGVIYSRKLRIPSKPLKEGKRSAAGSASVTVEDPLNCPRYTARILHGVSIGESPAWIRNRLNAVGIRPVNNVVDVTNYVLMEIGQPLHAFDYDRIAGHGIIVKSAVPGMTFITLDGKSRTLRGSELMICDHDGPIALAGVMGGANTEITTGTKSVFIESAYFNAASVRKASKYFSLSTDASQRFERGTDPNMTAWAADRAAYLIRELCGGEILKGRIDVYPRKIRPRNVKLRFEKVNEVLGTSLGSKEIYTILKRNSLIPRAPAVTSSKGAVTVEVPTRRPDIEREVDLIEEVARVYGYDRIPVRTRSILEYHEAPPERDFEGFLRGWLEGCGFNEIVTNSMTEVGIATLTSEHYVSLTNPISKEMAALRTSLVPSLLAVMGHNMAHGTHNLRLFEVGKAYFRNGSTGASTVVPGFEEESRLIIGMAGLASPRSWYGPPRKCDIGDLKGEVEALLEKILLDKFKFIPYPTTKALTDIRIGVEINGREAGYLGRVGGEQLKKFEIEDEVFIAELSLEALRDQSAGTRKYRPLPKYPSVLRDIAITVDQHVEIGRIEEEIKGAGSPLLKMINLFDVYKGEQVKSAKKSCAFALEFMSEDHTLTQQEVDGVMKKIIDRLGSVLHASLRT